MVGAWAYRGNFWFINSVQKLASLTEEQKAEVLRSLSSPVEAVVLSKSEQEKIMKSLSSSISPNIDTKIVQISENERQNILKSLEGKTN